MVCPVGWVWALCSSVPKAMAPDVGRTSRGVGVTAADALLSQGVGADAVSGSQQVELDSRFHDRVVRSEADGVVAAAAVGFRSGDCGFDLAYWGGKEPAAAKVMTGWSLRWGAGIVAALTCTEPVKSRSCCSSRTSE